MSQPRWRSRWKKFAEYQPEGSIWITVASAQFYPDYLAEALSRYRPAIDAFGVLLGKCADSTELFRSILSIAPPTQIALLRIFRRYVSPTTPVELLKRASKADRILADFSHAFRPISEVAAQFSTRPRDDEAIAAILWEHQERGKRGIELTDTFFTWVRTNFPGLSIRGGRDVPLKSIFPQYPKHRGADFVIEEGTEVLAIGFLHYDSDRGGAQEGDRTGGYADAAEEIVPFLQRQGLAAKLIFINDGPGLLAGAMWRKYGELEDRWPYKIMVATLKMLPMRLTLDWLRS